MLNRNHRAGHLLRHEILRVRVGECLGRGDGQETAIQGALEVALVATDRVVHGYQVGTGGESSLDLELDEGCQYGGEDVAAAEHCFADGHQIGDGVLAIAD